MRLACPRCKSRRKHDTITHKDDGYRARVTYLCGSEVEWDVSSLAIKKDFLKPCPMS